MKSNQINNMKKLITLICVFAIFACKQEPKDYATISGKITNPDDSKTITIFQGRDFSKEIKLNDDGTFNDTLKVEEGVYTFKHGDGYGQVYLKNDNETSFTLDSKEFDKTLKFQGDDANRSNFYIQNSLIAEKYLTDNIFDASEADFTAAMNNVKADYEGLKSKFPDLDASFFFDEDKKIEKIIKSYTNYFQSKLAMRKEFPAGKPSPTFVNYENYKGGTTSLNDFKGKYVYVDVWATWCGPCKREIPSLKKLEKEYHGKNIEFVSISVDNGRGYKDRSPELAKEGWKKMVADKQLGGVQLYSDKAFESDFILAYKIKGIPRFILIDPQGNIVNADAPRPSSPAIKKLFNTLNI